MDRKTYYNARKRKDRAFEGKFYIGVKSTGCFCRVTCPAPMPKNEDDMVYFSNIYEALDTGLRPCLDCNPDIYSEDVVLNKEVQTIIKNAVKLISEGYLNINSIIDLANNLHVSERHLRKLFMKEIGISPTKIAIYHKTIFAKKLLLDTDMSITDIAYASGFGSIRQFNHTFKDIFQESPSKFRKKNTTSMKAGKTIFLHYNKPFNFDNILKLIKKRSINGVEIIEENKYSRTFCVNNIVGHFVIQNNQEKSQLEIRVFSDDMRCYMSIYYKVKRMFDLNTDFLYVNEVLSDSILKNYMDKENMPRLFIEFNPYECTIKAILEQQIGIKDANELVEKIVKKTNNTYNCDIEGLSYVFPDVYEINDIDLRKLGVNEINAKTINSMNNALINNEISLAYNQTYDRFYDDFMKIEDVNDWIVNYVAIRGLGMADVFSPEIYDISEASVESCNKLLAKEIMGLSERCSPYRSYAALCLKSILEHKQSVL